MRFLSTLHKCKNDAFTIRGKDEMVSKSARGTVSRSVIVAISMRVRVTIRSDPAESLHKRDRRSVGTGTPSGRMTDLEDSPPVSAGQM